MKSPRLPLAGLCLLLLLGACKKNDFNDLATPPVTTSPEAAPVVAKASEWKTVAAWKVDKEEELSVYHTSIADPAITADVANEGMVLVYKSNGEAASFPAPGR